MDVSESTVTVVGGRGALPNTVLTEGRRKSAADVASGQGEEALKDIVCGSIAGVVGKYIEYPFDTVKVRLQSQPDGQPLRYTGPLDCFKKSLQRDGFIGIYRGISAPLVGAAVETSTLFFSVSLLTTSYFPQLTSPSIALLEMRSKPPGTILSFYDIPNAIYHTPACCIAAWSRAPSRLCS